ncbi:MAG: 23S rRNA (pseudouridine(1915)-N(3))-methyltransferase RlmH [Candidatus Sericytochromatia bacterium]|nr:23S rRNA (pseudouridine(1915)-N(3))-methyltransferase RlmH [Candidatus Sericytochromatia bacterium]
MRWTILAMGKLKEAHWRAAAAEYLKRLAPYRAVEVVELPDERADPGQSEALIAAARSREGDRILAALRPEAHVIAMWEQGEQLPSTELAARLAGLEHEGLREAAFVIGGANGLDPRVLARSTWKLGLSRLTLPHQLARVVLVEQLYRAERIRRLEPYHR